MNVIGRMMSVDDCREVDVMSMADRPAGQPERPGPRRLTRSRTDRVIAGVCGGFAAYSGIDANIVRLVMGHGLRSIGIGLVAGIAMAVAATRLLASLLFNVAPTDVATFIQVAGLVSAVSVLACAVPAARLGGLVAIVLKSE